jgi:hypothetical protein
MDEARFATLLTITRAVQVQYLLHSNFCSSDPSNCHRQHLIYAHTDTIDANTCTYLKVHLHNILKTFFDFRLSVSRCKASKSKLR